MASSNSACIRCSDTLIVGVSPITQAFRSTRSFVQRSTDDNTFASYCVTKEEYAEGGSNACRKKFSEGPNARGIRDRNEDNGLTSGNVQADKDVDESQALNGQRGGRSRPRASTIGKKAGQVSVVMKSQNDTPEPDLEEPARSGRPGTRKRPPRGAMKEG
jgi:hypothetical protein